MMRKLGTLFALAIFALMGHAQTAAKPGAQNPQPRKSPLADYAGTWTGAFQSHTWITVKLALQGDQLQGSIQHPRDIQFDNAGEIKSVSDEQSNEVLEKTELTNDGLLLFVKDQDTQESKRFLMHLTNDASAEIKMLAMSLPPGLPKLKPWKLTKLGAPTAKSGQ